MGGGGRPIDSGERRVGMSDALAILPANEASWEDLQAVFGARGTAAVC